MEKIDWNAQWIWNEGEESPRNEWWRFRKSFELDKQPRSAKLSIVADSRYVLYVNGTQVGRGPVRSWPKEQRYDTYEVSHLLTTEKPNQIAVLVNHFGISTFYYVRGRGGLLAQLDLEYETGEKSQIQTDDTWLTARFFGQDETAPRMACQQAFVERIDARQFDAQWILGQYDDSHWSNATVIGSAGIEPWTELLPRDIPLLTEETIYPKRVESLAMVESFQWSATVDLRNAFMPDSINHADRVAFSGYLATTIYAKKATTARLGFVFNVENVGDSTLNGVLHPRSDYTGEAPENFVELDLNEGENLFIMNVTDHVHAGLLHIGLDSDEDVYLTSPISAKETSPFAMIGPFEAMVEIDTQENPGLNLELEAYRTVFDQVKTSEDLAKLEEWVKIVPEALIGYDDAFGKSVWKKTEQRQQVPHQLQQLVIANGEYGEVPVDQNLATEMVIDFGTELSGYISFDLEAPEGTVIDFYGFEYLDRFEDYKQHTYNLDNTLRYITKSGRQSYTSAVRKGFRYLMVTVRQASEPVKWFDLNMQQSNYPIAEVGRFHSSDALLNDIWEISETTTKLCMEDTFVDCPAYEQVFWVGDSRNEALISNYLYGDNDIVKRCLRLVQGSKDKTPLYMNQVPSGWTSVIPNWTFFWAIACYEYYEQTGDMDFAQEIWPDVAYTLDNYLDHIDEQGLLNITAWNLLDWAALDQPHRGVVAHQNFFMAKALNTSAKLAMVVGDADKKDQYNDKATTMLAALNEHLWDEDEQAYIDAIHADGRKSDVFSMQTQVVAYLTGVNIPERDQRLEELILQPPKHFVQIGSPFMSFFLYEAYEKIGEQTAIVDEIRDNYRIMIDYGATTCWEMYPNHDHYRANPNMPTRSHCHAWSAAPAYFLPRVVLGVQPVEIGWKKVVVKPNPSGLTWANGSVPVADVGRIDVSWKISGTNKIQIKVIHPSGVDVDVVIPEGYEGTIDLVSL